MTATVGSRKYSLVDLGTDESASLLLCSLSKDREFAQTVHVLRPGSDKQAFVLGRSHEVDVRINDNSVSRVHARVRSTAKGFVLEDSASKFGTLVLLRGRQELSASGTSVQVGRTIVTLAVKVSFKPGNGKTDPELVLHNGHAYSEAV